MISSTGYDGISDLTVRNLLYKRLIRSFIPIQDLLTSLSEIYSIRDWYDSKVIIEEPGKTVRNLLYKRLIRLICFGFHCLVVLSEIYSIRDWYVCLVCRLWVCRLGSEIYSIRDWYKERGANHILQGESEIYSIRDWYYPP